MSLSDFFDEFALIYQGLPVQEAHLQYQDYVAWEHNIIQGPLILAEKWVDFLSKHKNRFSVPYDFHDEATSNDSGSTQSIRVEALKVAQLKELSATVDTTFHNLLFAAFGLLLYQLSSQETILVGIPSNNRVVSQLEHLSGLFVNTLPIPLLLSPLISFKGLITQVNENISFAIENQLCPYDVIVRSLGLPREAFQDPLLSVMFVMNFPLKKQVVGDLQIEAYLVHNQGAKFDLTLFVTETCNGLQIELEYAQRKFKSDAIDYMLMRYNRILDNLLTRNI
jgi:non-ribosomal peptide synthetase component F